ncbi:uncharacterized protein MEPE_00684 [Melanopsichium pennsylvanicum]|uniref:Senescence domain-containing protein n=2 Tax=Melanopsichium pennsylvanicum TaxID=63383 RepID=A0AAJ4XGI8_9BASI|nr:conserved hypothetical protein [Melanopsichium pennsylvanicum 4]SNX81979.1 uncharacterized protein MEPE_00684 [Melanopsichium pennsylvanicum]
MSAYNADHSSKGVEILNISGAVATQEYHGETVGLASGNLEILLVSIELHEAAQQASSDYSTDLWLVLSIGDDFSLPVAATQIITPQRNASQTSYNLPSLELEGASIRIAIPATTSKSDVTRFEQILSQYAAYIDDDPSDVGKLQLMTEDGQVLGVVQGNFNVHETDAMSDSGNEKAPVLIDLPPTPTNENESQDLQVDVLSAEDKKDWLLRSAGMFSRTIVKASEFVGGKIQGAADSYMSKHPAAGSSGYSTPAGEKADDSKTQAGREPIKVGPKTHAGVRTLHGWSGQAVQVSSKTTGAIIQVAGNIGDKIGKKTGIQRRVNPDGTAGPAPTGIRGFVNRSLIAANTVLDGIDAGAQTLLSTSGNAASDVVGHRYGEDARQVADGFGRTGKNIFIIYRDVRGVRRSALLKAARSRVLKAKLDDGREVTVHVDEKGNAVASEISNSKTASSSRTAAASTSRSSPAVSEKSSYMSASSSVNQGSNPPSYSNSGSLPPPPSHPSTRRSPSPKY